MSTAMLGLIVGLTANASPQVPDSVEAARAVREALRERYVETVTWFGVDKYDLGSLPSRDGWKCSPDQRETCDGGDWERAFCLPNSDCHDSEADLVDLLLESVAGNPGSGYLTGQTVAALVRFGRHVEAMEVAQGCTASEWWCAALEGHVLWSVGQVPEAESRFRQFAQSAPDSIACAYRDASSLLGTRPRRDIILGENEARSAVSLCMSLSPAASDTIWWLSDPLYIVEGNDRWAAHVNRMLQLRFHRELFEDLPRSVNTPWGALAIVSSEMLRRGPWDSYEVGLLLRYVRQWVWTSSAAAQYHFVPDFEDLGFERPAWTLGGGPEYEGYSPPYAFFYPLRVQLARFKSTEEAGASPSMKIALATTARDTPLASAVESVYLTLTDGPGSFPVQLQSPYTAERAVYLAEVESTSHVLSVEVVTGEGVGRHRIMVTPLEARTENISDLLLYEPTGSDEPHSLIAAAALMLASADADGLRELGVYWEVYGAPADASVTFSLQVEREGGGFFQRLRSLLPGGPSDASGTLSWTDASTGLSFPMSIVFDLESLSSGEHTLLIRASWNGGPTVERRRAFVVR